MPAIDARRAYWLWINALAAVVAAHVAVGLAAAFVADGGPAGAAALRGVWEFFAALPVLVLCGAFVFGVYGRGHRWFWLGAAAIMLGQVVIGFMGYVMPLGQITFWLATKGIAIPRGLAPLVVLMVLVLGLALHLRHLACAGRDAVHHGRYAPAGLLAMSGVAVVTGWWLWRGYALGFDYGSELASQLAASPLSTPAHLAPPWYTLPFFGVLRAMPEPLSGVAMMVAFAAVWLLVPWLDRGQPRAFWQRRGMRWLVPAVGLSVLLLGVAGAMPMQGNMALWITRLAVVAVFALLLLGMPRVTRRLSPPSP